MLCAKFGLNLPGGFREKKIKIWQVFRRINRKTDRQNMTKRQTDDEQFWPFSSDDLKPFTFFFSSILPHLQSFFSIPRNLFERLWSFVSIFYPLENPLSIGYEIHLNFSSYKVFNISVLKYITFNITKTWSVKSVSSINLCHFVVKYFNLCNVI